MEQVPEANANHMESEGNENLENNVENLDSSMNEVSEEPSTNTDVEETGKDPEEFSMEDAEPFREIKEYYLEGKYCDFDIYCGVDQDNPGLRNVLSEVPIRAHRLMLAAGSVTLRQILYLHEDDDQESAIILRDFQRKHVKDAVDALYERLTGSSKTEMEAPVQEVLDYLDMNLTKPQVIKDVSGRLLPRLKGSEESGEPTPTRRG